MRHCCRTGRAQSKLWQWWEKRKGPSSRQDRRIGQTQLPRTKTRWWIHAQAEGFGLNPAHSKRRIGLLSRRSLFFRSSFPFYVHDEGLLVPKRKWEWKNIKSVRKYWDESAEDKGSGCGGCDAQGGQRIVVYDLLECTAVGHRTTIC